MATKGSMDKIDVGPSKDDIRKVEQSLFAEAKISDSADESFGIGLLQKPNKEDGLKPIKEESHSFGQNIGEEKSITLKVNPGRIKENLKRGLFWLVFTMLVVSFFYNPFYTYFPWNKDAGVTGNVIADTEDATDDSAVTDDMDTADEEAASEEPEPAAAEEEATAPAAEEEPSVTAPLPTTPTPVTAPAENTTQTNQTNRTAASSPHSIRFEVTDAEIIKTTYGWKIGKVSFTIANNKGVFTAKVRARGFNTDSRMDARGDQVVVIGDIQEGDTYTGELELNAQLDTPGEKLVYVELYDEGDSPGAANDRKLASVEKKVTAIG